MSEPEETSDQSTELKATFMRIILDDVIASMARLDHHDTQPNRRDLIRVIFAAIEGLVWTYREHIMDVAKSTDNLGKDEEQAFSETSYSVTQQGKIVEQARFVPLLGMVRLATRLAERINPGVSPRFDEAGWSALRHAVEIRNRVTHPKSASDLEISDGDLSISQAGFNWLLDMCVTAMSAATAALKSYFAEFSAITDALKSGDPAVLAEYALARKLLEE